ncbi:MAG: secondary thiamine-phosphate synthase enzyme YjbQ [Acidobacteriota bacterium]|nr:secondary thiamine-phosphate synthase enzyme YjbQ [Acidobacteriota bacterium]
MVQTIKVRSRQREEMIDITAEVKKALRESNEQEGTVVLFVQHTTCGLTVNENADPDVQTDLLSALRKLIPQHGMNFKHAEDNSDAHLKSSLFGSSVTIPFANGELLLGRWQGIYLCEFDGARERKIVMLIR